MPVRLREPARRVSPRAVGYWTVESLIWAVPLLLAVWFTWYQWGSDHWWVTAVAALVSLAVVVEAFVAPRIRYAVHRWEVASTAVYTQTGWLSRERRIVPLSRVQTVDSKQGPLQRIFGLASVVVTTASKAGHVAIEALDAAEAEVVVEDLTRTTSATPGDAT